MMETPLKLISSNIRFANTEDGVHDWVQRKGLLQCIYHSFAPDFLGTQEGRIGQIHDLAEGLKSLSLIESHRSWIPERMYPCLFFNPETVALEKSGDIWLSTTPEVPGSVSFNSAFPRLCTWAEVTLKKCGTQLIVVNTHLDHVLSSSRMEQAKVLIEEVSKISSRPVVIMGDFNESPLTALKQLLMESFKLKDPWEELSLPEETSHHGFQGKLAKGDRIDWILVPRAFQSLSITLEKRSFMEGIFPSDHYPLLATVIPKCR